MKAADSSKEDVLSVFISYSWDSEEHKEWVLQLARNLEERGGLKVIFDRFQLVPGALTTHFMELSVAQADKVLLIMTPRYKDKADNRTGGVGYECSMITQEIYEKQSNNKFIPIRRIGTYDDCAPRFLKPYLSHDMTGDDRFERPFEELIKILYGQSAVDLPVRGPRPNFAPMVRSSAKDLIDHMQGVEKSQMRTFAKWSSHFTIRSLADKDKMELYDLVTTHVLLDRETKHVLPWILANNFKTGHHPDINFSSPLIRYIAYNHLIQDALALDDSSLCYEFVEYSDYDFWLLYTAQPFSSIFYLLVILKRIHESLKRPIDFSLTLKFKSDRKAMMYSKYSPFTYPMIYNMQQMIIPGSEAVVEYAFSTVNKDSVFSFFQKVYSKFIAEKPESPHPFIKIDREHFNMLTSEFLNE